MDRFNQPSPGIKTTRQINQMLCGFFKEMAFYQCRGGLRLDFFLQTTNNRTAKLNQEHDVQSCTNHVVKNNWLNTVERVKK